MKKIVLSVLLISCLSIHETLSQGLLFRLNGSDIKKYNLDELSRITKPAEITIYEPHELRNRTYTGFSTADLLKNIYKENLQNNKDLYITCTDGYKPSIPVVKFLTYPSYLVFKASGDEDFMLINKNQNNEAVELKPFYLIWDNIKHPELREQGAYDFPYQIESVDLISFEKKFSKMSPPASSSDRVKRGFVAYIKYCSTCHTMNGEGGSKALELNYPVNITEYIGNNWLKKWIDNPSSMRYGAKMPALNPALDKRDEVIDDIMEYLNAMKEKKISPESD